MWHLVGDVGKAGQFGQLYKVEPRHVCDPLARLRLHSIQVQRGATYAPHSKIIFISYTVQ